MATKKKPSWKVPLSVPFVTDPNADQREKDRAERFRNNFPVGSVVDHYWSLKGSTEMVEPFEFDATLRYHSDRWGDKGCTGVILRDVNGAIYPMSTASLFEILKKRGVGPDMEMSGLWGFKKHGSVVTIVPVW